MSCNPHIYSLRDLTVGANATGYTRVHDMLICRCKYMFITIAVLSSNPRSHGEIRLWEHGSYTLVHDTDADSGCKFSLDAMLYCGCKGWKEEYGGHTTYIAKGEDEEVMKY